MVNRTDLFPGLIDSDVVEVLKSNMKKLHLTTKLNVGFTKVEKLDNGMLRVHLDSGETIDAEKVLSALGRKPNLSGLKLDNAGVELRGDGAIKVDEY